MICCDICTVKQEATKAVWLGERNAVPPQFSLGDPRSFPEVFVCDEHLENVRAAVRSVLAPGTCPVCGRLPDAAGCASPFHDGQSFVPDRFDTTPTETKARGLR